MRGTRVLNRAMPGGRTMELIIIPALTTVALFILQAREYFTARQAGWNAARYPEMALSTAGAPPIRRKLTPYVIKPDDSAAERAA
jgi:hypothetical protein